jgi:hypothetical protein
MTAVTSMGAWFFWGFPEKSSVRGIDDDYLKSLENNKFFAVNYDVHGCLFGHDKRLLFCCSRLWRVRRQFGGLRKII